MKGRTKVLLAAGVVTAAGIGIGGAVIAGGDSDQPISRSGDRERAGAAALRHVGEGRVTETEQGDEESYYEVEVTRDDGSQVDVQLDRSFSVVGQSEDEEDAGPDNDGG